MRYLSTVAGTVACVCAAALTSVPASVAAQDQDLAVLERWQHANWVDEAGFMALNAVMGGLVGGLAASLRGEVSFAEAFRDGAFGGAVVYGGKRLSAARWTGAGALGRAVVSFGGAVGHAPGGGLIPARFTLPYGPLRLHVDRDAGSVRVKPDVVTTYWTLYGALHSSIRLDAGASLSSGAAVFVTNGVRLDGANGSMVGGVIFIDERPGTPFGEVFAHERVHVAQRDQLLASGGLELEGWAASRLGLGDVARHVDFGAWPNVPMSLSQVLFERAGNPFEVEADFLEHRTLPRPEPMSFTPQPGS